MEGWRKNEREENKREEYTGILYIRKKEERERVKKKREARKRMKKTWKKNRNRERKRG